MLPCALKRKFSKQVARLRKKRTLFELLKLFFTLSQAPQLYAPHPIQVSPPTSLQYMSDPGTVMGSSGVVSGFLSPTYVALQSESE